MDKKALLWHIVICLLVGGLISYFTSAKWLAAAYWVSAAMFINGSLAYVEDGVPGGFDNPDGDNTPDYAKGSGATIHALKSLTITIVLAAIGLIIQEYT